MSMHSLWKTIPFWTAIWRSVNVTCCRGSLGKDLCLGKDLDSSSAVGPLRAEVKFWNQPSLLTVVTEDKKGEYMGRFGGRLRESFLFCNDIHWETELWSIFTKAVRNIIQTLLHKKSIYIFELLNVHLPGSALQLGTAYLYSSVL